MTLSPSASICIGKFVVLPVDAQNLLGIINRSRKQQVGIRQACERSLLVWFGQRDLYISGVCPEERECFRQQVVEASHRRYGFFPKNRKTRFKWADGGGTFCPRLWGPPTRVLPFGCLHDGSIEI